MSKSPLDRIYCWKHTLNIVKNTPASIKYDFKDLYEKYISYIPKYSKTRTIIRVDNMDSIDCGLYYQSQGYTPIVLNLADNIIPGGFVHQGCAAQEESLFRRTSLCTTLVQDLYPILPEEGIYSPKVDIIKTSEKDDWILYKEPKVLDFLSVPGIKYPNLDTITNLMSIEDCNRLRIKIRLMLLISIENNHDCIVLGASGCGAWCSPPQQVAEIFNEVLEELNGWFQLVTFAIIDSKRDNNLDIFRKVLCT